MFVDHFSEAAGSYRGFRPHYPPELFEHIAAHCAHHDAAWECGAGSGQATLGLTQHFDTVFATDASLAQLRGFTGTGVHRIACLSERCPLPDHSVDLVAAAQCVHWFDLEAFFREVRRVAKPQSIVALWTYNFPTITPEIDRFFLEFAEDVVGQYWAPQRTLVNEGYRTLPFPFTEIAPQCFEWRSTLTGPDILGLWDTWSAVRQARCELGYDPVQQFKDRWMLCWGGKDVERTVTWPITLRLGQLYA